MSAEEEIKTKDFSAEVEVKVPEFCEPAKKDHSKLDEAVDNLMMLEKKTRLAVDVDSTLKVCLAVLDLCKECGNWSKFSDIIGVICKRRAQLDKVIRETVREGVKNIENTPNLEIKTSLIITLRVVSEGKLVVELERARLTRMLAEIREAEGDISAAAEIMQESTVETIGSMEAGEKLNFLLDQVRLCYAKNDFVRMEIISKKIKPKHLTGEDVQDQKIRYNELMIGLHLHNKKHLDVCLSYEAIFRTPKTQETEEKWKAALQQAVLHLSLSPYDHDMNELLTRFKVEKQMEQLTACSALLKDMTTSELITWPLAYEAQIKDNKIFQLEEGTILWTLLHKRITQHNIRVICANYTRISAPRLATLLKLDHDTAEEWLCEMVSEKQLHAKIDRRTKIVTFNLKKSAAEELNVWGDDISSILNLVESTCHLINKEKMLHGVA